MGELGFEPMFISLQSTFFWEAVSSTFHEVESVVPEVVHDMGWTIPILLGTLTLSKKRVGV